MRTGALPPEGLITGRAVPTALRTEALIRWPIGLGVSSVDQGFMSPSAFSNSGEVGK